MFSLFQRFIRKRQDNHQFLRQIADEKGREVEKWSFERSSGSAEELSFSCRIDGVEVFFSIEAYESNEDGDLHVCMDVNATFPTFPYFKKPSHVFWKCRDGRVYY